MFLLMLFQVRNFVVIKNGDLVCFVWFGERLCCDAIRSDHRPFFFVSFSSSFINVLSSILLPLFIYLRRKINCRSCDVNIL